MKAGCDVSLTIPSGCNVPDSAFRPLDVAFLLFFSPETLEEPLLSGRHQDDETRRRRRRWAFLESSLGFLLEMEAREADGETH